jgi:hypothetical protein
VLVPHITPHTAVESAARMLFPASLPRESRGRRAVVLRSAALTYDAASRTDRGGVV